jgi:hypothetical protein
MHQVKRKSILLLLVLFIYCALSILLFDPKLSTGGDNAIYIILAESISTGKGYKNIYMPDEPEHTQYPFGFPLLLALFMLIFGSNILGLKVFILLFGCGATYFMYKISSYLIKQTHMLVMLFYLSPFDGSERQTLLLLHLIRFRNLLVFHKNSWNLTHYCYHGFSSGKERI